MFIRIKTAKDGTGTKRELTFGYDPNPSQMDDGLFGGSYIPLTNAEFSKLIQSLAAYEAIKEHFENVGSVWQVNLS